ncbi:AAA family ATPase [sulfur-oxidizing endosymbiont of Gigantopelta aegis]|uniref:AAA family ATPase n=1 Tax=sulfur-oxidizing endosymbiont of Gigantopelta aegis TaxID=2794934 RepID=UPI0018DEA349|nr:MoxR family ATPase [sulfur-oxidizing endosymbiont of Gigantopelta aegis]
MENTATMTQLCQSIKSEMAKAVIGQTEVIEQILVALIASGHVLIEGVPGLGKTLMVQALAKTFDGDFARIQFTPDLMPSDVTGHVLYDMKSESFKVRKGPVFTNLLLADEINRAPAKTQAALLEVMQEQQVTLEGRSMSVSHPYMVLATQNPIEQEGTYPLPEAQLDRFLFKVLIAYPEDKEELQLVQHITNKKLGDKLDVSNVACCLQAETVLELQQHAASLEVDEQVVQYAINIVRATREWPGISIGSGPRGGIALIRAARAYAVVDGRDFITPDDVKKVTLPAMRHRIILSPEMELEGVHVDQVLKNILDKITAPRH